jgi:transposase-like protein
MPLPSLLNLTALIDDAKCHELVRRHRWPDGVRCPTCDSATVARHGRDDREPYRQRSRCAGCGARFDDLSGTALAGHHQPLRVWVLCLYLMGLNLCRVGGWRVAGAGTFPSAPPQTGHALFGAPGFPVSSMATIATAG